MIKIICDELVMKCFNFGYNPKPVWLNFSEKSLQNIKNIKKEQKNTPQNVIRLRSAIYIKAPHNSKKPLDVAA